jgi:xanthine dehydrogenase accessory factor
MSQSATLRVFLMAHEAVAKVRISRVLGSAPRAEGTEMFVAPGGLFGTIGGGQLEFRVIDAARALLERGDMAVVLDLPLGPEIGQCCGGRVEVALSCMSPQDKEAAVAEAAREDARQPSVYVLGAGHVGRALCDLFQHLPVRCVLVDQREEELAQCAAQMEQCLTALPEAEIASAPDGSVFIVTTHDHGLDFLLASTALGREDAAYVGLIGSATKRANFRSWGQRHCDGIDVARLVCPIGAGAGKDKRPTVIAAMTVAEVMAALSVTAQREADSPVRHFAAQ